MTRPVTVSAAQAVTCRDGFIREPTGCTACFYGFCRLSDPGTLALACTDWLHAAQSVACPTYSSQLLTTGSYPARSLNGHDLNIRDQLQRSDFYPIPEKLTWLRR